MSAAFHRPTNNVGHFFVKDVTPCKAFDMYGYSVGWTCFLKIRLFNPVHVYKCADLLLSGSVTGHSLQPYESHISFQLAFLADYNLYGCDWLEFSEHTTRTGGDVTVRGGREIDLRVESILNRQKMEYEKRHTQVFETQSDKISISSLSEARAADAKWRERTGAAPWKPQNLHPFHQDLSLSWPWERRQELADALKKRIEENREAGCPERAIRDLDLDNLPPASQLVPSHQPSEPSSANDLEWIMSDPEDDGGPAVSSAAVSSPHQSNEHHRRDEPAGQPHRGARQLHQHQPVGAAGPLNLHASSPKRTGGTVVTGTGPEAGVRKPRAVIASKTDSELIALFDQLSQSDSSLSMIVSPSSGGKSQYTYAFGTDKPSLVYARHAPTTEEVMETVGATSYTPVHFGEPEDVAVLPLKYGGKEYHVKALEPANLPAFEMRCSGAAPPLSALVQSESLGRRRKRNVKACLELVSRAPSTADVDSWLREQSSQAQSSAFTNASSNYQFVSLESREKAGDEMTACAIEVHVCTRPGKVPKAAEDPIRAVFWQVSGFDSVVSNRGVITTTSMHSTDVPSVVIVESERAILEEVIRMVRFFNPDILTGYELNASSWGYARVRYKLVAPEVGDQFYNELGRVKNTARTPWRSVVATSNSPEEGDTVRGRHMPSLWNCLRKELSLSKYTLEYVVYHIFHERTPHFSYDDLTQWWTSQDNASVNAVVRYWSGRVALVLRLLAHFEIINRTCEKSRIIGIDFWSSLTRGSQFQVEAVMCRLARRENYVLISPSKAQVGQQNALEYIPLVMEPLSEFYTDPVCVLDFRSLYPSIVIALNLCYSTSIGRVNLWRSRNKLGIKQDHCLDMGVLSEVGEDNIYVAPNGVGYVSPRVRKSLLAQMLGEILDTRFMINETLKNTKATGGNTRFRRNLHNKQLALKFIANVTYGYTSASFSGRMPCAELADSIVLAGREILQWCIHTIESCQKWAIRPQVVYGDTDSLFVKLPGTSRAQAFRIGREIAAMITAQTPEPITLKLEKVYSPSILLTKKRYVGNAYEHEQQEAATFDAKGIETIRRDGTPIVQRIEKRALQILFETCDLSRVKSYLYNQWRDILTGRNVKLQEFCFAQEVKLGHYKTTHGTSNLPGGAVVSLKRMLRDDGIEPQYRERVPFVITAGAAGTRINDRAVAPDEMIRTPALVVDSEYYIQKAIIPPLERLFNLLGANVREWYSRMPRTVRLNQAAPGYAAAGTTAGTTAGATAAAAAAAALAYPAGAGALSGGKGTLNGFLRSETCAVCLDKRRVPHMALCADCSARAPRSRYILASRAQLEEQKLGAAQATCHACCGAVPRSASSASSHACQSIDCPVFYEREAGRSETELSLQLLNALI